MTETGGVKGGPRKPAWSGRLRRLWSPQLRFAVSFALLAGLFLGLYHFPYADGSPVRALMGFYLRAYARSAGVVLRLFDRSVAVDGVLIAGRFSLRIVRSCDAGEAKALLIAAMLAFPSTWRNRLFGIAAGVAFIFVVNILRICSLYVVGVVAPAAFEPMHAEIWPPLMAVAALAAFLIWTYRTQPRLARDADVAHP